VRGVRGVRDVSAVWGVRAVWGVSDSTSLIALLPV